jgi:colanic acid/amylovoran biosynthesis glycosyltransferase
MALGLPVVATRHGGIPELVEDAVSGILVPERDSAAIADAVARLLANPAGWAEMGRAGRAAVEARYDNDRLNDALMESYEAVLQRLPQPAALRPELKDGTLPGEGGATTPLDVQSGPATNRRKAG